MRAPRSCLGLLGTLALAVLPAPAGAQAVGSEFQINTYTTGSQRVPSVASDASGDFVVVWSSSFQDGSGFGVFGQRYDSGGATQGTEFRVNSYTTGFQIVHSIASDARGSFVVVWTSIVGTRYAQDGPGDGVFGQRFDSEGVPQGDEFRVNSYTTASQFYPSVASDPSGNFVVAWSSSLQDGSGSGVFGQRYNSAGRKLGDEFRVNSYTTDNQRLSSVASDASGNIVVVWQSDAQDGSGDGVFGQRYGSGGVAQGAEFQINSYTTNDQTVPSIGATGTNQFVVAWSSTGQDGSSYGVFGQRYDFGAGGTIKVESPHTNVRWRIGSLQKIQWTHNLGPAATFRIELDRDNDGNYEELIAAAAPASSDTKGSFAWTVTGPPSGTARVRISWTDDLSVSDASDTTFQIGP